MNDPEHNHSAAQHAKEALQRIDAVIQHDVEETRAIEPLVDKAGAVQQQVRSKLMRALPLLGLVALGAGLFFSGVWRQLTDLDTLARQHHLLATWADMHPLLASLTLVL